MIMIRLYHDLASGWLINLLSCQISQEVLKQMNTVLDSLPLTVSQGNIQLTTPTLVRSFIPLPQQTPTDHLGSS